MKDEFQLIETFFNKPASNNTDDACAKSIQIGIGDDAACLRLPPGYDLLITTDTLVSGVHFLETWAAEDIGYRSVAVNVSDIAAMGGKPCWASLALTIPDADQSFLDRFSKGLHQGLNQYGVQLIGGDLTKGPLTITLTIHGLVPSGKAVRRSGAKPGDQIWVTGTLGAAALALTLKNPPANHTEKEALAKLYRPTARTDMQQILQDFASAAIDISDGLTADLAHICRASGVGATLFLPQIPVYPLVYSQNSCAKSTQTYQAEALDFALSAGDEYELCFTTHQATAPAFIQALDKAGLHAYPIGLIEPDPGLWVIDQAGNKTAYTPQGYQHF